MKFYREKKVVDFEDKKVELYELTVKSVLKSIDGEYKDFIDLIVDNSNLTREDFEEMSAEAFNIIEKEFLALNDKHFSQKGEKTDKKKS